MKSLSRRLKHLEEVMHATGLDDPLPPEDDALGRFYWAQRMMARPEWQRSVRASTSFDPHNPYLILLDALERLSPKGMERLSLEDYK